MRKVHASTGCDACSVCASMDFPHEKINSPRDYPKIAQLYDS